MAASAHAVSSLNTQEKAGMRVRRLVGGHKTQTTDTSWSIGDLPPRHAPFNEKTRPIRAGWKWRSAKASGGGQEFVLTALCNPKRDKWQAVLSVQGALGWSVVGRFEHHGDHPGLHVHSHCGRSGVEVGSSGMNDLARIPDVGEHHRRNSPWNEASFWEAAKTFYRIKELMGPLFDDVK